MSVKEMRDVLPENNAGVPVVPQILTNRAGDFLLASKKLAEMGYREINLNLGCPSGTVTAKKKGSGFLLYPDDLDRFFDEVFSDASVRNGEFQISVKTRIGKNEVEEWPEIMEVYNRYPISELTVHPRIQKEFYKGVPHLDVFADILKESRNPVVYNGDLFTAEHMKKFREKFPSVENVMIGRGLIRNPDRRSRCGKCPGLCRIRGWKQRDITGADGKDSTGVQKHGRQSHAPDPCLPR